MTEKEYKKLVDEISPNSPIGKDCLGAFVVGGLICTLGQCFINFYAYLGLDKENCHGNNTGKCKMSHISALIRFQKDEGHNRRYEKAWKETSVSLMFIAFQKRDHRI